MSPLKGLTSEGTWIVVGQIVAVIGALALVRVLTEYLDPAEYGQLALGLTVAGLVNQTIFGAVSNGVSRFYAIAAEKRDLGGYLHATWRLLGYAALGVVAISLLCLGGLWWLGYSKWTGLAAAALAYSVLGGYSVALSGIQNAARQRAIVAFHSGLEAWLRIGMAVCIVLWLGASSSAVVIGYACSSLLITSSQLFFLRRAIPRQVQQVSRDAQWVPQIWAYSLPFAVWGVFTWLQTASDRWALQAYASSAEVGQYTVVFQLGYTPIALAMSLVASFLAPILYELSGDATDHSRNVNVHRLCWTLTNICLVLTALGFAIAFAMHEWLFRLLVATEFRGVSYLLPWALLAGGLFAAGQMLALKLMSEIRSSVMTKAKIVTALLGVLFNVVGAAFYGMRGVMGALVGFSLIYLVWMAVLARHLPTGTATDSMFAVDDQGQTTR